MVKNQSFAVRVKDNFNDVNLSPRPGIHNVATMATNHVTVVMGQVATSPPRYSHYFFSNYIISSHYDPILFFSVQESTVELFQYSSTGKLRFFLPNR